MTFVLIPPGTFTMGSEKIDGAKPHEVKISREFWLSDREVTAALFAEVVGRENTNSAETDSGPELPVFDVSWFDAVEFCNELSKRHGFDEYYRLERIGKGMYIEATVETLGGDGYRLPTEAEWEYACRAKSGTIFCYGDDEQLLGEYAVFSGSQSAVCGSKLPNGWGLFDMHGNAYEWCHDWYADHEASPLVDPSGPPWGSDRVDRGGGWFVGAEACGSALRSARRPGSRFNVIGFRVARSPSGKRASVAEDAATWPSVHAQERL